MTQINWWQSCPKNVVKYNWHQFIGKKQQQVLWWDYRAFAFDINSETVTVVFTDNSTWTSQSFWAWDLNWLWSKIINDFYYTNFVPLSWNTTQLSYIVSWWFMYFLVTWAVNNNLQITIRNDNTWVWADWSVDPESDWLEWRMPSLFSISWWNTKCDIIELWNKDFDCANDEIFFISEWNQQTIDWEVFGWSEPEWVQWSNIPVRDNRSRLLQMNVDTDGIGYTTLWPVTNAFTSWAALIDELNNMLIWYGSTFRLIWWVDWNRIFVTQLDWTIVVWDSDPYLTSNIYNNLELVIEDATTNSDWLIKLRNPKWFSVSNVEAWSWASGMFVWKIPCSSVVVPTPQISIAGSIGIRWNNVISFVAKYNESDRWILDYEPEIYVYVKKKRRGSNASGKHNIRYKHKLCHSPQRDTNVWSLSLKKDVNPRLNANPDRNLTTEWLIDWTQTEMTTQFTVSPFQFLGSVPYGDTWTGSFPMMKADWNSLWSGTVFPATMATKSLYKQNDWQWRPLTHMTLYFKTVIRNPNWWHPIESTESYPIVIYPDVNINTWDLSEYTHWWVNINYSTR